MYSLPHIQNLRSKIFRWNLPRPEWFDMVQDKVVQEYYNGIGSEKYKLLLGVTTKVLSIYEPAALIHDVQWSKLGLGMCSTFEESNGMFRAGCHICASHAKPIIHIFRPSQRRMYHEIGEDLFRVVNGPIGEKVWESIK